MVFYLLRQDKCQINVFFRICFCVWWSNDNVNEARATTNDWSYILRRIFSSRLLCAPKYRTTGKIECQFHLRNNGKQDYLVLKWRTPLDGLRSDCLTVTTNGKKLQYDGIYPKRSAPGPDQYLLVKAGQTVSSTFDVSDAYDMTKAGLYSIAVDTYLEYVAGRLSDVRFTQTEIEHLSSPAVSYEISKGSFIEGTFSERARPLKRTNQYSMRGSSSEDGSCPKLEHFVGVAPEALKLETKKAFEAAVQNMKSAIKCLKDNPAKGKPWFGTATEDAKILLKKTVAIVDGNWHKTFHFGGDECSNETLAYSFHGACTFYLCKLFSEQKTDTGYYSKMGIIVHELTHAISNTTDDEHGPIRVQKLAKASPKRAALNGANFAHFVESLTISKSCKSF